MKIIVCENYEEMSKAGAEIIAETVKNTPSCVLGLATGSTPVGAYEQLIDMYKKGDLDFSNVTTVNLDEYKGLSGDHDQSYRYFMQRNLFDHVNIDVANTNVPNGLAEDVDAECARYNEVINTLGPIDIQVLGMGHNGHIGFNEPDENLIMGTHRTMLTQDTIEANSRLFNSIDEVPTQAITMGMVSILKSKMIVLLANGKNKHEAVKKLLDDTITTSNPATFLKTHPNVVIICDEECYNG